MNFWDFVNKHVKAIHRTLFVIGLLLIGFSIKSNTFSWDSLLKTFPIVAGLTAAYLLIRLDIWRDDKTIIEMTNAESTKIAETNEKIPVSQVDLISRRSDYRVAFILLVLIALIQSIVQEPRSEWQVLVGMLLILLPMSNWIARCIEKDHLLEFKNR